MKILSENEQGSEHFQLLVKYIQTSIQLHVLL